jgi:hypothetical protein
MIKLKIKDRKNSEKIKLNVVMGYTQPIVFLMFATLGFLISDITGKMFIITNKTSLARGIANTSKTY